MRRLRAGWHIAPGHRAGPLGDCPRQAHHPERPVAQRCRKLMPSTASVKPEQFHAVYEPMFSIHRSKGEKTSPLYAWRPTSTYIRRPPYWDTYYRRRGSCRMVSRASLPEPRSSSLPTSVLTRFRPPHWKQESRKRICRSASSTVWQSVRCSTSSSPASWSGSSITSCLTNAAAPIAVAVDAALKQAQGTTMGTILAVFPTIIKVGAVLGLNSTMVVMVMGQPACFYSMSKDGLLPEWAAKIHRNTRRRTSRRQ